MDFCKRSIVFYADENGNEPFQAWMDNLRDKQGKRLKPIGRSIKAVGKFRTLDEFTEGYFRDHPDEIDDYLTEILITFPSTLWEKYIDRHSSYGNHSYYLNKKIAIAPNIN